MTITWVSMLHDPGSVGHLMSFAASREHLRPHSGVSGRYSMGATFYGAQVDVENSVASMESGEGGRLLAV